MRKVLLAALLALGLSGCAAIQTLENAYQTATTTSVSPQVIYVVVNAFDELQNGGTVYLTSCRGHLDRPVCSAANRRLVIQSVRKGRPIRAQLETYLQTNSPAPATLFNVLRDIVAALQTSAAAKGAVQ